MPHHCLDLVDPAEDFDVARYRLAARAALADIHARGRPALVVGGTGLWLRVLLRGLCPAPPRAPAVRAALRVVAAREGAGALHRRLAVLDPPAAARIHPHDTVRLERALEVVVTSGRRLSDWQAAHGFADAPYDALVFGLMVEPAVLAARIAARAEGMIARGFVDEVRALVARGIPAGAAAWRAVGYRELRAYVEGACDLPTALAAATAATRRFARRQRTWFRAEPDVVWRDPQADRTRLLAEATAFLARGVRPAVATPAPRIAKVPGPR